MSKQGIEEKILSAIRDVLAGVETPVPLHEPFFYGNEWRYVRECLDSNYVSSVGRYVDEFEKSLAEYTGTARAVGVVNGTAALHTALILAGVGAGDEVLVPTLTFIATVNAVSYTGAVPHFTDSEENTLGMDPEKLGAYLSSITRMEAGECVNRLTGRKIKAMVPMHAFGHPADLDGLCEVSRRFSIPMIEDAAEALGTFYKGRHVGNRGRLSILSFNGNKILTTGGGGAVLTNDTDLAELARHITTTAKVPHRWAYAHDRIGYNYRMPNLNAALGFAQMENLPAMLGKKRELARRYAAAFSDLRGIRFFVEPEFARSNYWLNALLLEPGFENRRDTILSVTHENGYLTRPAWTLIHSLPMYAECPKMDLSTAESIERRLINLPSGPRL